MLPRLVALGPRLLALGLATVALELVIAVPGLATEQRLSRRPFARSILPDLIELPPDRILPAHRSLRRESLPPPRALVAGSPAPVADWRELDRLELCSRPGRVAQRSGPSLQPSCSRPKGPRLFRKPDCQPARS